MTEMVAISEADRQILLGVTQAVYELKEAIDDLRDSADRLTAAIEVDRVTRPNEEDT